MLACCKNPTRRDTKRLNTNSRGAGDGDGKGTSLSAVADGAGAGDGGGEFRGDASHSNSDVPPAIRAPSRSSGSDMPLGGSAATLWQQNAKNAVSAAASEKRSDETASENVRHRCHLYAC